MLALTSENVNMKSPSVLLHVPSLFDNSPSHFYLGCMSNLNPLLHY